MLGVKQFRRLMLVLCVGLLCHQPGWAANECGFPSSQITCPIDESGYADGIKYTFEDAHFAQGIALTLASGASVVAGQGKVGLGLWDVDPNDADIIGSNLIPFTLTLEAGTSIEVSAANAGNPADFIAGVQLSTNARVTATIGGDISVDGLGSEDDGSEAVAVHLDSYAAVGERYVHQLRGSTIQANGYFAFGISILGHDSSTNAVVRSDGAIEITGQEATGVAVSDYGQANNVSQVLLGASSRIDVAGTEMTGAYAMQMGLGSASIDAAGVVKAAGLKAQGLLAIEAGFAQEVSILLRGTGQVTAIGDFGAGLASMTTSAGDALVTTHGRVSVQGEGTLGVAAVIYAGQGSPLSAGRAVVRLEDSATVSAVGKAAHGVLAFADNHVATGSVYTSGGTSVQANGAGAVGIGTFSQGDGVAQISGEAGSRGEHGAAVMVRSQQAGARVVVGPSADISGGWQADLTGRSLSFVPPNSQYIHGSGLGFDLLASGVTLSGATSVELENAGRIGALSDRAVHFDTCLDGVVCTPTIASITNSGQVTGFIQNSASTPTTMRNQSGGTLVLRHFADTDGDGTRDTKRVSLSQFGGAGSTFTNSAGAKVQLGAVAGAGHVSTDQYYLPSALSAADYAFGADGRVQAQLLGLAEFSNSGVLDLRGAAAGNSLVMTSNSAAGGAAGTGVYVANGGQLLLNTHFSEGIPAGGTGNSLSDVLVVDETRLGSGATTISIARRTGTGGESAANGILLVEVRNKSSSADGVFALAGDYEENGQQHLIMGAQSYVLAHNGIAADASDGNWYLRSASVSPAVQVVTIVPETVQAMIAPSDIGQTSRVALFRGGRLARNGDNSPQVASQIDLMCGAQDIYCVLTEEDVHFQVHKGNQVIDSRGFWTRLYGAKGQYQTISLGVQRGFQFDSYGLQTGVDHPLAEVGGGRVFGGLSARLAHTSGSSELGTVVAAGAGVGGSVTYIGDEGFLLGAEAEGLFYRADINSAAVGKVTKDLPGFSYSVRLVSSQRVDLTPEWAVTPEVELIYSNVKFSPFTDPWGAQIDLGTTESLKLTAGFGIEREIAWTSEAGRESGLKTFAKFDLEHELLGARRVSASGSSITSGVDLTWVGASLGGEYSLDGDKAMVFGEVGLNSALDHFGSSYQLRGNAGFKVQF